MSRRILLADDSVTIQKVIELTFMDDDYEVKAVSNGDEALAILAASRFDFVIADVHMPGANGFEVCRQAKLLRPNIPVLLLVGTFEPFDEAQSKVVGADAVLKKPFDSQELLQRVQQLMGPLEAAPAAAAAPAVDFRMPPEPAAAEPPRAESAAWSTYEPTFELELEPEPTPTGAAEPVPFQLEEDTRQPFSLGGGEPFSWEVAEPAAPPPSPTPAAPAAADPFFLDEPAPAASPAPWSAYGEPAAAAVFPAAAVPPPPAAVPDEVPFSLGDLDEPTAPALPRESPWAAAFAAPEPEPAAASTEPPLAPPVMDEPFSWTTPVPAAPAPADDEGDSTAPTSWGLPEPAPLSWNLPEPAAPSEPFAAEPPSWSLPVEAPSIAEPPATEPAAAPPSPFADYAAEAAPAAPSFDDLGSLPPPAPQEAHFEEPPAALAPAPPAAESAAAEPAQQNGSGRLSEEDVDRIARRVIELLGDKVLRDVAWEVIPDMAEVVIKGRLRELEAQVEE